MAENESDGRQRKTVDGPDPDAMEIHAPHASSASCRSLLMEGNRVDDNGRELVSVKTLSRLLDISEKTIWDWIYKNRRRPTLDPIPYYKLGGLVRFNLVEVRAWVERRKVRPLAGLNVK